MKRRLALLLIATSTALAPAARAQAPAPVPPRPPEGRRDEAFRMVDAYIISNVQESLGLSDDQFVKVLPVVKRLQRDRRDFQLARSTQLRELRRVMQSGVASEAEVVERLKELKGVEADGPARVKNDMDALDALLSPLQQAKYRLLEVEVEQRLRELMTRARPGRPGQRPQRE